MFCWMSRLVDQKSFFLSNISVASYLPGRIRCYSPLIKNNPVNKEKLLECFREHSNVVNLDVNLVTGSVLITYSPKDIERIKELGDIEKTLIAKFRDSKTA